MKVGDSEATNALVSIVEQQGVGVHFEHVLNMNDINLEALNGEALRLIYSCWTEADDNKQSRYRYLGV